jgi:signal transduction histidine kinase
VIATGEAELVRSVPDEAIDEFSQNAEQARLVRILGLRSYMIVPLTVRERLQGVVAFISSTRSYDEDHLALARELGRRLASAIENALLFADARAAAERMTRLQAVTAQLARALTAEQVAETVIREGIDALGAANGVLCLASENGQWLDTVRSAGFNGETLRQWKRFAIEAPYPLSDAVRTGRPVFLESRDQMMSQYPALRESPARTPAASWTALPLLSNGKSIGGLAFGFPHSLPFTTDVRAFATALAQQCALALERARLLASERAARAEAEEARARAEEANRVKTEFLAVMSHELRTPLNAIAGYAELLEIGIHGPLTASQRDAVSRIQRSERHLLGLINDVLNFAKLEAGHVDVELQALSVHEALAPLESLVAPQLQAKALCFDYQPCASDITAWGDAEKVRQILLNLVSNAIKFTDPGGAVTVSCCAGESVVHLNVTDTGCGIPEDKLDQIFEPFVQLRAGPTRTQEGTGLGLAISRDLARAMDGEIVVESRVGHGSRFGLVLPRA